MAGGHMKYRQLGRHSAHRQSLLRNLVTSLIKHESITTTWPKAKEAQRLAEKLITHAKKNTNASRLRAQQILFSPLEHIPALFGPLRERYLNRPGGYTRVLRTEPRNKHDDQAPTAILELVDGPRDMRFAMTARTVAWERKMEGEIREVTVRNIAKVTRFRADGEEALQRAVSAVETASGFEGKGEQGEKEVEIERGIEREGRREIVGPDADAGAVAEEMMGRRGRRYRDGVVGPGERRVRSEKRRVAREEEEQEEFDTGKGSRSLR